MSLFDCLINGLRRVASVLGLVRRYHPTYQVIPRCSERRRTESGENTAELAPIPTPI